MKTLREAVERMEVECAKHREAVLRAHVGTGMDVAEVRTVDIDGTRMSVSLDFHTLAPGDAPPPGTTTVYRVSQIDLATTLMPMDEVSS
jgi:hypothetical protein